METRGWIDLSERGKMVLRGPDAERYLQGQTTNDVTRAGEDAALYSLITNAKGKLEADVFISRWEEGFLVDGPPGLREELRARLEKYIIADDVTLEDVTEDLQLYHVPGADRPDFEGGPVRSAHRYGIDGWDCLQSGRAEDTSEPSGLPGPALTAADLEPLRIARGIPRWGAELTTDILPQEARLEDRAIDFQKGCYIGQEVISRIKSVGKVNKLLCALVARDAGAASPPLQPGMSLFLEDGTEAGRLTSLTKNAELDRITALGYVQRGAAEPSTILYVHSAENKLSSPLEIRETPLC